MMSDLTRNGRENDKMQTEKVKTKFREKIENNKMQTEEVK